MKGDLTFTAIVAAAASVPLFVFFGWLCNPHGSIGSVALHLLGLFGIYPFLYVAESFSYQSGVLGVILAALAQHAWFAVWVFLCRRAWRVWRPDDLPKAPRAPQ